MSVARTVIETVDITKIFGVGDVSVVALNGVSIRIAAGEFIAIMGPSGSGKSTLMHILGCLSRPTSGKYILDGEDVSNLDKVELAGVRNRKLGFIFQAYNLLARTSALKNVTLPLLYNHDGLISREEGEQKARAVLETVGLADRIHHQPHELSGGQQQRVAIARALINDPTLVIADEPTGNLDSKTAATVFALFNQLVSEGKTVIIVTHDSSLAKRAHRTALIADGEIVNEYVTKALPMLTHDQLLLATHRLKPRQYEAGAMILVEGKNSDAFYIVSKGTVEVVLPRQNQSDVIALELGPGKYFGEMEFFHERRSRASIRACESCPVEVLAISYDQLNELLGQSEVTRETLHKMADKHKAENLARRGATS